MTKILADKLKRFIGRLSSRQLIEKVHSQVNPMLEVVRLGDTLMLNTANANYSFGGLHRVFQRAFKKIGLNERDLQRILILGFGAGSVAAIIREELNIEATITAVEYDPVVIALGRRYFNSERYTDLELVEADAAAFISNEKRKYDLIVVDVYIDFKVPGHCESDEFIKDIFKCLAPGGMVVFNKMIYNHEAREEAHKLEILFRKLPGKVGVINIREGMLNKIIVFEKGRG
ncbi:MAG: fused MFS/spermidine synthase [Bacteroidales bacterium]|nr:fused MFS/spermidine synthase [Bacteroidales bacterium]